MVHVLTGPDHLSALATLSANVSSFHSSFFLGVRWGVGHSTGLLLVGIVLIVHDYCSSRGDHNQDDNEDVVEVPDYLTHIFESLVGVFMLFLGIYGLRRALLKRHESQGSITLSSYEDNDEGYVEPLEQPESDEVKAFKANGSYLDVSTMSFADMVADEYQNHHNALEVDSNRPLDHNGFGCRWQSLFQSSRRLSAKTMALIAGIIHGLAGPGGVLGVIPAVQLHDWKLATLYLGSFCLSSTLTMGCFAIFYGTCSSRLGRGTNLEFQIHCFSACLSILVGVTWLVLLWLGKLEDVFP